MSANTKPGWALNEPDFVYETYLWCNKMRAEDGKEPLDRLPKGWRRDGESCPCGKATGWYVDQEVAWLERDEDGPLNKIKLPEGVCDFVVAFDRGELPQYDEAPA